MPIRSLFLLDDGIFVLSDAEDASPYTWRLRSLYSKPALETLLKEVRAQIRQGLGLPDYPPLKKIVDDLKTRVGVLSDKPSGLPDIDYVGVGAYCLWRWIFITQDHEGNPSGETVIDVENVSGLRAVALHPEDADLGMAALGGLEHRASIFFTRPQGFGFVAEIPDYPEVEREKMRQTIVVMGLPESGPHTRVDIYGEAAKMIFECLWKLYKRHPIHRPKN